MVFRKAIAQYDHAVVSRLAFVRGERASKSWLNAQCVEESRLGYHGLDCFGLISAHWNMRPPMMAMDSKTVFCFRQSR